MCYARLGIPRFAQRSGYSGGSLIAKQKQRCSAGGSDSEQRDVVLNEIWISHQGDTEEHRFPDVHPFSVNERDESDRAEKQSGEI